MIAIDYIFRPGIWGGKPDWLEGAKHVDDTTMHAALRRAARLAPGEAARIRKSFLREMAKQGRLRTAPITEQHNGGTQHDSAA